MINELPKIIKYKRDKYILTTIKEHGKFLSFYGLITNNKKGYSKALVLPSKKKKYYNIYLVSWFENSEKETFNYLLNLLNETTYEEEINNII